MMFWIVDSPLFGSYIQLEATLDFLGNNHNSSTFAKPNIMSLSLSPTPFGTFLNYFP